MCHVYCIHKTWKDEWNNFTVCRWSFLVVVSISYCQNTNIRIVQIIFILSSYLWLGKKEGNAHSTNQVAISFFAIQLWIVKLSGDMFLHNSILMIIEYIIIYLSSRGVFYIKGCFAYVRVFIHFVFVFVLICFVFGMFVFVCLFCL